MSEGIQTRAGRQKKWEFGCDFANLAAVWREAGGARWRRRAWAGVTGRSVAKQAGTTGVVAIV